MMDFILDDPIIRLRLSRRPEFLLRLHEFALMYQVGNRPALVVQAAPHPDATDGFPFEDEAVQKRFGEGEGQSQGVWWGGFRSWSQMRPTFHGVAGLSGPDPSWACEMHRDGHFMAGVWKFPPFSSVDGSATETIADFYCDFFKDFCNLVRAVLKLGGREDQPYEVTATLLASRRLGFAGAHRATGQHMRLAHSHPLPNLQWPIAEVRQGGLTWAKCGEALSAGLTGAYGFSAPR